MILEQFLATSRGGILYDASRLRKPEENAFVRDHWRARGALEEVQGGRGSVAILHADAADWVLRHYRRGGWMARLSDDRYLWTGADRTRSFREWRLLAELASRGLPVPYPIAARFVRHRLRYSADLITERLMGTQTLARAVIDGSLERSDWESVGRTIAAFHAAGSHHADLNANNILLASTARLAAPVYLIDFDRGRLRERGPWESQVIARLRRSLDKLKRQEPQAAFGDREWEWLMKAVRG